MAPRELGGRKAHALRELGQVLAVVDDRQAQEASPLLDAGRRQRRALDRRGDSLALGAKRVVDHQQRARRRDGVLDVHAPAQAPSERDGGAVGVLFGHVRELDEHRAVAKVDEERLHDAFLRRHRKYTGTPEARIKYPGQVHCGIPWRSRKMRTIPATT